MTLDNNGFITRLDENEIFVFGSNLKGEHLGGAAKLAYEKFGAQWGNPLGLQGKSFAIPTLDENMKQVEYEMLVFAINDLVEFAEENSDKNFLLTPIGTGIAGFTFEEINSILPELPKNIIKVGNWS